VKALGQLGMEDSREVWGTLKLVMARNLELKVISKCTVIISKSKPELKFAVIFFFCQSKEVYNK